MAKKMTMADIANLSGVGKSTVSRYFNGGYVKDETRAKIQKVIEEYNYTPNAFARLNAKQSNVIGVVVPTEYPAPDPVKCGWDLDQFHSDHKGPQRAVKESGNSSGCFNTGL